MKITNQIVRDKARNLGFDLVGFAEVKELNDEVKNLTDWLSKNYQAGMAYMERNVDKRKDVTQILSGAKSVISLATNYYTNEKYSNENGKGKISRYAWGTDYHYIIWDKLAKLENDLKEIDPEFESKSYVDTGPVMDKAWAVQAGIGWMGKHSNIINRKLGSWIFLSTIITNYNFEYSEQIPDFCGSCTACIDACPTGAIVEDYIVDANKCISYLTIENKGEIPGEFKNNFDNWLFGCDVCQDVCPWNIKFSELTNIREFYPLNGNKEIDLIEIKNMTNSTFKQRFNQSPLKRAKLKGLKRNAEYLEQDSNQNNS